MQKGNNWINGNTSQIITEHPAILKGILVSASADITELTVYDGLDASSGRLFKCIDCTVGFSLAFDCFEAQMMRGIYVAVDAKIGCYTIIYEAHPSG